MKNKEPLFIKEFKIEKMFGIYNVDIPFTNNINIFVGENGLGKTTILNALNYVIQGDSESLSSIEFERIVLVLGNNTKIEINHDELLDNKNSIFERNKYIHSSFDENYNFIMRRITLEIIKEFSPKMLDEKESREKILNLILRKYKYDFSPSVIEKIYDSVLKDNTFIKKMKESWEYKIYDYMKEWGKIIYLPTYRRIEEDFNSYIDNDSDRDYYRKNRKKRNFSYLQFGMDDVQEAINNACNTLRNNTNEGFKGMTSNLLTNYIKINEDKNSKIINNKVFNPSTLEIVFSRLTDKIDPNIQNKIISMIESDNIEEDKYHQYLISIINELTNIYEKNKQIDDNIENFKNVCNNYLVNKQVEYNKFKIECNVQQNGTNEIISLKNLSSGEKQILSLFSKLYLLSEEKNIILFDEPELSLSILWQKELLPDIINSNRCSFITIITHSPFIFDNDYSERAIDIKEYITIAEV